MSATGGALAFIEKRLQGLSRDDLIALAQAEDERQKRYEEALYRGSLFKFVEAGWQYIDPAPFVGGWHLEAICEHLEAVTLGQIRRLLINVPPRSSKSSMCSVAWPTWTWAQPGDKRLRLAGPKVQFLFSSYAQTLALRDSVKSRRLVESPWYQRYWGEKFQLVGDQNTKQKFETTLGGYRLATSVGGALTGDGGDIVVVDDPHNAQEVPSDTIRQGVLDWWDESMSTRLNDPISGAFVIVMQRLHQSDLAGHILESSTGRDWVHLCLPMEYEGERHCRTRIGWNDPRGMNPETGDRLEGMELKEAEGRLLCDERFPPHVVKDLKSRLGTFGSAGQLQQRPSPKGGGILKSDHWKLWDAEAAAANGAKLSQPDENGMRVPYFPTFSYMLASLDTAYTEKEENDPSALTIWGIWHTPRGEPRVMLVFAWAERMELNALVNKTYKTCKRFRIDKLIIEDKAAGHSVAQELRRMFVGKMDWSVQLVSPEGGDKVARAYSVQGLFEEGMIYAPDKAWADETITECEQFPRGTHDDRVDSTTQAIRYLRKIGLIVRKEETEMMASRDSAYTPQPRALYSC